MSNNFVPGNVFYPAPAPGHLQMQQQPPVHVAHVMMPQQPANVHHIPMPPPPQAQLGHMQMPPQAQVPLVPPQAQVPPMPQQPSLVERRILGTMNRTLSDLLEVVKSNRELLGRMLEVMSAENRNMGFGSGQGGPRMPHPGNNSGPIRGGARNRFHYRRAGNVARPIGGANPGNAGNHSGGDNPGRGLRRGFGGGPNVQIPPPALIQPVLGGAPVIENVANAENGAGPSPVVENAAGPSENASVASENRPSSV